MNEILNLMDLEALARRFLDLIPNLLVVKNCGSSSVDLLVRVWIDDAGSEQPVYVAVMGASKRALDAAGIEIPLHHLRLFLEDVRKPMWDKAAGLLAR
jgi:small-conductance mechanosensitive channel